MKIMNRLKELRKEKSLTQQQMADYLGMSRRGYQKIENGESQLKIDRARDLAKFFWVKTDYLLGYDDKRVDDLSEFFSSAKEGEIIRQTKEEFLKDVLRSERKEKTNIATGRLKELNDEDFNLISAMIDRLHDSDTTPGK